MNLLTRLAALTGIAWLATRPAKGTVLNRAPKVGDRVRVKNQHAYWDGATGVITDHYGTSWTIDLDNNEKYGLQAAFKTEKLEVIA